MVSENKSGKVISLQVSTIGEISNELFSITGKEPFLVKNITDENIVASIKPASCNYFIETVFYPGWNPEIVTEIKCEKSNTLQYGY